MLSKEEREKAYWEGYIAKQNESMEICKQCKYIKKAKELEHEKDIMQRALSMQTQGWNECARLFAEKQKLIEKLEEDIKVYSREGCCRKQVREGIVREAQEILSILKGKS